MVVSTCQKITFVSCIVVCMSLFLPKMFLPREKKDKVHTKVGPGHFPPIGHGYSFSEDYVDWNTESNYNKHYIPEVIARTKSVGKPNLLVQVIPVYGFGIFLYIIYLFFKLTSKDKPHRQRCIFPILPPEHILEEMPACPLATRTCEKMREKRISKFVNPAVRSRRGTRRREEKKLKQFREITQMMQERQLREGVTPEEEAEETPYTADWEGYSEETYPEYDIPCRRRRYPSVILEEPDQVILTAEELAERMEKEEEDEEPANNDNKIKEEVHRENDEDKQENDKNEDEEVENDEEEDSEEDNDEEDEEDDIGEDQPCLPKSFNEDDETLKYPGERKQKPSTRRQITFSDHRHVFHYPIGGAVGCKYEEEEEHEEEEEEEEDEDEEEENGDEDNEDPQNEEERSETEEKEEDPLMEAESLGFNDDVECDPEEQEVDLIDFLQTYQPEVALRSSQSQSPKTQGCGTLRMRNKKQNIKK
ncbi:Protein RIC-3 [Triplophysa tibetana]|uniref:Protein RIC-3 n=1 Tax=Triplophysa tibetana TaxID=1572043 RepID=A0A5A9PN63_9TELE|nr:Protein RIC-3 [Triplophysa tibetana]